MYAYILGGIFAAIGGILLLSRLSYADPNAGNGYEMNAIASTVIGGIALSGGKGKIANTLVGALILGSLTCGLQILNVPVYYQTIITGLAIVGAVYLDKAKERKAE
jgi:ribose transport system permease protein